MGHLHHLSLALQVGSIFHNCASNLSHGDVGIFQTLINKQKVSDPHYILSI